MAYIYMDESWDLNYNSTYWSKFFVVTFLITKNDKDMKIIMKSLHSWMKWKWIKMKWTFFHSTKEDKTSVKRLLDLLSRRDIKIVSIIVNKSQSSNKFTYNKHDLYNRIVSYLLQQCEKRDFLINTNIKFIASRRETNKNLNQNFINTINNSHSNLSKIDILIKSPKEECWLEIADAVCHAIYKKYEENNFVLYSVIKNKIVLEKFYENQNFWL